MKTILLGPGSKIPHSRLYHAPQPKPVRKQCVKTPEELDHTPLGFGRYALQTPSQIAEHDPAYIVWLARERSEPFASELLINDCIADCNDN